MSARPREHRRSTRTVVAVVFPVTLLVATLLVGSCGSRPRDRFLTRSLDPEAPTIVVTFPVTAALVAQLVGDSASVEVLMPNGTDPHDYRPSARDVEELGRADLVVANGFDLEEGLTSALAQSRRDGTPIFWCSEWVPVRWIGDHDGDNSEDPVSGEHDHGGVDPHFWVDPVAMSDVMVALAETLGTQLGLDVSAGLGALESHLSDLDASVAAILDVVPSSNRLLVTGHESLGYFAHRYGFEIVGTVVSSMSSQAAPSAADIAALKRQIESLGVTTIFNEVGTPKALSRVIADETGVRVVDLNTHKLPGDRSYSTFMIDLATAVADGLEPRP